jgi:hypothetical protein
LWVSLIGTGFPLLALILFVTERRAGANGQA